MTPALFSLTICLSVKLETVLPGLSQVASVQPDSLRFIDLAGRGIASPESFKARNRSGRIPNCANWMACFAVVRAETKRMDFLNGLGLHSEAGEIHDIFERDVTDAGVFDFSDVFRINAAAAQLDHFLCGYLPPACLVDAGEDCADTPAFSNR